MVMKINKEKSWGAFCDLFGATARNRVLELFLEGREMDNSLGNIADEGKLNRATVYNVLGKLLKQKVILPTRKIGRTQLYQLNLDNEEVKALIRAFDFVLTGVYKEIKRTHKEKITVS